MSSRGAPPGDGDFVGMAAAMASSRRSFEPLGSILKAGRRGEFKPFGGTIAARNLSGGSADRDDPAESGGSDGPDPFAGTSGLDLAGGLGGLGDCDGDLPVGLDGSDGPAGFADGAAGLAGGLEGLGGLAEEGNLLGGADATDEQWPDTAGATATLAGGGDALAIAMQEPDGGQGPVADEADPIAALAEQRARELEAVRAEYGEGIAERISAGLKAIEQHILNNVGAQVAQILTPVLHAQARNSSVAAFIEALREILAEPGAVTVRVEGPDDLLQHVQAAIGSGDARLEFRTADQVDLRAQMADSVVTTRLAEWADELTGAMDAQR